MSYKTPFILLLLYLISFVPAHASQIPLISEELPVTIEVLSWSPRIFVYRHFLSEVECDHLIEQATPYLTPSTVVDETLSYGSKSDFRRKSEGMSFSKDHEDPILKAIEKRISLLTLIPPGNGEDIQILYYQLEGEYQPHYDYFSDATVGGHFLLKSRWSTSRLFSHVFKYSRSRGRNHFPLCSY